MITAAKTKHREFIIQYQDAVTVDKQMKALHLFFNAFDQRKALLEGSLHEMLVDLCCTDINECLYAETVMLFYPVCLRQFFQLFQCSFKHAVIAQVEMCIEQVVQSFYVVACFHPHHQGLFG